ncbi:hypothetical protein PTTG_05931 [Puccinia triticina 1-1 BBBD Race 1]|uniref:Uncharacterized protein n=1 Tax=Puccinia triticina (isolate 1-1 / race 1 (BBBD)) TaxID=630390 RepID=A0A0C4EYM9_PUCT1|nr:hypothetical protein PTTG_05931 [Puccinia triticina 1-1 BBBD Race 1]
MGRAICGQRTGSDEGQNHNHGVAEATLFLSALQSEVLNAIQMSSERQTTGFTPEVAKDLYAGISNLSGLVESLIDKVGTGRLGNAWDGDLTALEFLKGTKKVMDILRTSKSTYFPVHTQGLDASRKTMALAHLNDALVKFLIIFERHKLASPKWLEDLLNEEEGGQIMFNYLARRFPGLRDKIDVPNLYLITDLMKALQESPFTAELQGLFKYFKLSGWHRLERSYLSSQISAFDRSSNAVLTRDMAEFRKDYTYLTKTTLLREVGGLGYMNEVGRLLSRLEKQIGRISRSSRKISRLPPITQLLSFKVLHRWDDSS